MATIVLERRKRRTRPRSCGPNTAGRMRKKAAAPYSTCRGHPLSGAVGADAEREMHAGGHRPVRECGEDPARRRAPADGRHESQRLGPPLRPTRARRRAPSRARRGRRSAATSRGGGRRRRCQEGSPRTTSHRRRGRRRTSAAMPTSSKVTARSSDSPACAAAHRPPRGEGRRRTTSRCTGSRPAAVRRSLCSSK